MIPTISISELNIINIQGLISALTRANGSLVGSTPGLNVQVDLEVRLDDILVEETFGVVRTLGEDEGVFTIDKVEAVDDLVSFSSFEVDFSEESDLGVDDGIDDLQVGNDGIKSGVVKGHAEEMLAVDVGV